MSLYSSAPCSQSIMFHSVLYAPCAQLWNMFLFSPSERHLKRPFAKGNEELTDEVALQSKASICSESKSTNRAWCTDDYNEYINTSKPSAKLKIHVLLRCSENMSCFIGNLITISISNQAPVPLTIKHLKRAIMSLTSVYSAWSTIHGYMSHGWCCSYY